jgi:hypothetical protein
MWRTVLNEIQITDKVRQTLTEARDPATQRAHCAALARFVAVCTHLDLKWQAIASINDFQYLLTQVLEWAGANGAKLYWITRMRTAV